MKTVSRFLLVTLLAAQAALAASPGLGFNPSDNTKTVLERLTGQQVELRITSGEKIAGKVEKVGDKAVHLVALTGQEFFEAFVVLDDISAIVVRAATK
jgi:hypothetical protein